MQCLPVDYHCYNILVTSICSFISSTAPLINDSEVVSVYEIRDHSLFNFRPGAAVVKDKDYEVSSVRCQHY